jgi:hypothetical protein
MRTLRNQHRAFTLACALFAVASVRCGQGFSVSSDTGDGAAVDGMDDAPTIIVGVTPDAGVAHDGGDATVALDSGDATIPPDGSEASAEDSGSVTPDSAPPSDASGQDAATGKIGVLGSACTSAGATACNGNDSQVVLICQGGQWTAYGAPCPSSQRCDSTVGACGDVAAGCVGLAPGATFCGTDGSGTPAIEQCGLDLVTTTVASTCGPRQSCTASTGSVACTCNVDPQCSDAGTLCLGSDSLLTCGLDSNLCPYASGTQTCLDGGCYGSAGSAKCCTDECGAAGSVCEGNTLITCALGPNGCLVQTLGTCSCGGDAGACGPGYCCSGDSCVAWSQTTCGGVTDGTCEDCTFDLYGNMCFGSNGCGCSTADDCGVGTYSVGSACLSTHKCGCVTASDCASSAYGGACLGQCGCASDLDCTTANRGPRCIGEDCGCNSASDCAAPRPCCVGGACNPC